MPAVAFTSTDFFTGVLSLLFTVMILSYLVGDNAAFRLAIHVFIGVSAGYVALIVWRQIFVEQLIIPLMVGDLFEKILVIIPFIFGLMLLTKFSANLEWVGQPVVAFLVGTGAAAAVAGAVIGTLFPQITNTIDLFDLQRASSSALGTAANLGTAVVILLGTVATLAYFQFTVFGKNAPSGARGWLMRTIALVGQVFIVITLGALFAGAFSAALTALIDRMHSIVQFFDQLLFPPTS
jgi:hypothetical protein